MAASLASQPQPNSIFRFLDLPGEIRNKIYHLLLCDIPEQPVSPESFPTDFTYLTHSFAPQILRTCRTIYEEAKHEMLKTNLYVRVSSSIDNTEVARILVAERIPLLLMSQKQIDNFRSYWVLQHMMLPNSDMGRPWEFGILHRDFDVFCRMFEKYKWTIDDHDEDVGHHVVLCDPYIKYPSRTPRSFWSLKFQETLIAPYSNHWRGYPCFNISGEISKDLARSTIAKVKTLRRVDPEKVLTELEAFRTRGNAYFRAGDSNKASENWSSGLTAIRRFMTGVAGENLRKTGGASFNPRVQNLMFTLSLNNAQVFLNAMREASSSPELLVKIADSFFHSICVCEEAEEALEGSTWELSREQKTKLLYKVAAGCRVLGDEQFLPRAVGVIDHLHSLMPEDAAVTREWQLVHAWRRGLGVKA
jgi:hypothetical protein